MGKFWLLILSGGYLLVAVKVASSIYVNQLNATKLKSSKNQFQFQFELSLAQLSPSLLYRKFAHIFICQNFSKRLSLNSTETNSELGTTQLKLVLYWVVFWYWIEESMYKTILWLKSFLFQNMLDKKFLGPTKIVVSRNSWIP